MNHKLLINALTGNGSCQLTTSEFRINIEYLHVIDDLNRIYKSYQNSNSLIQIQPGDSSGTVFLQAEAFLLSFLLNNENDLVDYQLISQTLDNYNLDSLTKDILIGPILNKIPLNLVSIIKNHFSSLNQSFFIDWRDFEDNEHRIEVLN